MVLSPYDVSIDSYINNFHDIICFVSKQKLFYCGSLLVKVTVVTLLNIPISRYIFNTLSPLSVTTEGQLPW